MRIRFELTPDDLAAYSLHYAKHSPEWRRQMRLQVYGVALAIGLSTYLHAIPRGWDWVVLGAVVLVGWVSLAPRFIWSWYAKHARRMYSENWRPGAPATHELELTGEALVGTMSNGRIATKYEEIVRVEEAGGYAFINLNGLQAHIIPVGRLVEGDGESFLRELKARLGKAV
ncbi:MAG: YcxB family protein [Bryobacterales bacterium]|nr:YcxB family protein [Bryobacterales bacterium]